MIDEISYEMGDVTSWNGVEYTQPFFIVEGHYDPSASTLKAITKNLLHLTLNTSTSNLTIHCLYGSPIPPPYNTPTFSPISCYSPTGVLYYSHPTSKIHCFNSDTSSVTTLLGDSGLIGSIFSSLIGSSSDSSSLKIIDLTHSSKSLYCLTADGRVHQFMNGVLKKLEIDLPEIEEWNMYAGNIITQGILQSSTSQDIVYCGVPCFDESKLYLFGDDVTSEVVNIPGSSFSVKNNGEVLILNSEEELYVYTEDGEVKKVECLKSSFENVREDNILKSIKPMINLSRIMSEITGYRDSTRERNWNEILRRIESEQIMGSPTSNIYRSLAVGGRGEKGEVGLREVAKGVEREFKVLCLDEGLGRKSCLTTILNVKNEKVKYVDTVLNLVEGVIWDDIFFIVEDSCRSIISNPEVNKDLKTFVEEYSSDFATYFKNFNNGMEEEISTYHRWCSKYSELKYYLKGYILLHATLNLGLNVDDELLSSVHKTIITLLGQCYILSQPEKNLEVKAARVLGEDKICREVEEVRVEKGVENKWSRWCDFFREEREVKKFWREWEKLPEADANGNEVQVLARGVMEMCKVKTYVTNSDGTPRSVVQSICAIEASQLITSKSNWSSLPQAPSIISSLIELECNLSLLNALSTSDQNNSQIISRCDRIITICCESNFQNGSTVAQVHSLKFASLLKHQDWERAHSVCMDVRNVDFERRKSMMRRLAIKMVESGNLESLCSSIPLIVMTGSEDSEACDTLTLMVTALTGQGYGDEAATLAGSKGEWRVAAVCAKSDEGKVACLSMVKEGEKQWIVKEGGEERGERFRTMKDIVKESMGGEKWGEWKEEGKWREAEDYGRIVYGDDAVRFGEFLNEVAKEVVKQALDAEVGVKDEWQFLERLVKTYGDKTNNLALNVASEILDLEDGRGDLPLWLTSLLTKSSSNSLFATLVKSNSESCDENAPGLLRLYVEHGLYTDAMRLVIECLGDKETRINEALDMDMKKLQIMVPYNVIDTLFELADETLMGGLGFGLMADSDKEDLKRYRDMAEESLRGHFEVLKVVAENEKANRAKHR
ncbi:hypothetical protein TL16_g10207 [Triparma laevis f. inornata]|uniref:Uncharacterized protein n=1 Tax=Triparma laevis f. inornata TaxID=1714386 RepID=A0A9W7BCD7_9STRA|nr:hypothetical protein TL16_g10207 [Triparma laevis f. inornata]